MRRAFQADLMRRQLPRDQWTTPEEVRGRLGHAKFYIEALILQRYDRMYVTSLHTSKKRIRRTRSVPHGTTWRSRSFARSFTRFLHPTLDWTNTRCTWSPLPNNPRPQPAKKILVKWKTDARMLGELSGAAGGHIRRPALPVHRLLNRNASGRSLLTETATNWEVMLNLLAAIFTLMELCG